jgi:hypothetical protein
MQYMCYRRDIKERSPLFTRYDLASDWAVERLRTSANAVTVTWHIMRREWIVDGDAYFWSGWKPVGSVYTKRYRIVGEGPNVKGVPWPCSTVETD